jgi:hypothetical protein
MKIFILVLISVFATMTIFAQELPNPGFEFWSNDLLYEGLENWTTTNSDGYSENLGAIKSDDAYSGLYSLELRSMLINEDSVFSIVYLGAIDDNGPSGGIAYTDAFDQVKGYYKCNMSANDSASIYIVKYYGATVSESISKLGGVHDTWT